ncbi:hypothetical protein [Halorubellus salinus]|uniref:hypothetical protein n=1 Tax=Halorubellus salinus TaxID=755309 RepID=UPI001D073B2B|nr:hypothetical protein [Halorubellus salinus]
MTGPVELGTGLAATGLVALAIGALQLRSPTFWLAFAWGIPPGPEPGWPEYAVRVFGGVFVCLGLAAAAGGAFVVSTAL